MIRLPKIQISKKTGLSLCIGITLGIMVLEFVISYFTGSLMLYSDGIHMLSHGLALGVSLLAIYFAERKKSETIEYKAALINGISLLLFTLYILAEAFYTMADPKAILVTETILIAVVGLLVNLVTAWILFSSGVEDLNTKSAFLHMLADTFSSIAIISGAIIIQISDLFIIDSIMSVVIAVVIGKWSLGLIKDSVKVLKRPLPKMEVAA